MHPRKAIIAAMVCAAVAPPVWPAAKQEPSLAVLPMQVKQGLDRMGTALRALGNFELKADVTTEEVLMTGQKLQNSSLMTFDVQRPNRMYIDINSPRKHRQIFYDGKQFTMFSPSTGYYGTVDAPATIAAMLKEADDRYGIEMPMADLFQWGTSSFPIERIRSSMYAGSDLINGQTCDHYAFRQQRVDWQIWINRCEPALPCKLVIVNADDASQPTTTAVYRWATGSTFAESLFHFEPPAQARHIVLGQVNPTPVKGGK